MHCEHTPYAAAGLVLVPRLHNGGRAGGAANRSRATRVRTAQFQGLGLKPDVESCELANLWP